MDGFAGFGVSPARRWRIAVLAAAALGLLPILDAGGGGAGSPACWVLPNAAVSYLGALDPGCPLEPYERIVAVETPRGERPVRRRADLEGALRGASFGALVADGSRRRRVELPVLHLSPFERLAQHLVAGVGALALLGLALSALGTRPRAEAAPVAVLCVVGGVAWMAVLQRGASAVLDATWIGAQGLAPAALSHLALVFPRERRLVERSPGVVGLLYLAGAALALFEWGMLSHQSPLWELPDRVIGAWMLAGSVALGVSSYLTVEESESRRERNLARALLFASAAFVSLVVVLSSGLGASLPPTSRRVLAVTSALLLAALAYGLARHAIRDAPPLVRRAASHVVYTALVAALVYTLALLGHRALGWPWIGADPAPLLAGLFLALLVTEQLRRAAWGVAEAWVTPWAPKLEALRRRQARYLGGAAGRDADDVMRHLVEILREAFDARRVTAFLSLEAEGWRLAGSAGRDPFPSALADAANAALATLRPGRSPAVVDLGRLAEPRPAPVAALRARGVALVCAFGADPSRRGLVLVGELARWRHPTSDHVAFAEQACAQAALAVRKADLEHEVLTATRMAAIGRAAAGLAHDLGRPLGEIFLEARGQAGSRSDDALAAIRQLAAECMDQLERFVEDGKRAARARVGAARLDLVVEAAADRVAKLGGGRQPVLRLAPRLPLVARAREVQRVVENLLENALQWSSPEQPVEVVAAADEREATLRVIDHGRGMSAAEAERAFDPFYSTRSGGGLGLTVCRDIVSRLGGRIDLRSQPGAGTTVTVRIPLGAPAQAS